jgi:hypothetical protein
VLGLYYGGTGWGIVVSSILVPLTLSNGPRGWQSAWFALAFACALFAAVSIGAARRLDADRDGGSVPAGGAPTSSAVRPRFGLALAGYGLFGSATSAT